MEKIGTLTSESLRSIIQDIVGALPGIIGALVVLIVGWIIIKITTMVLKRVLKVAQVEKFSEKINNAKLFGEESKIKISITKIILGFVKGFLWLMFIIVAADVAGLTVISEEIANLLRYLPVLLSAVVIFMIGMFAAKLIKNALVSVFNSMGIGGSKIISNIVYYIIIIFVLITALNQAGIDTEIITSNFTLILGAFLLAFAIGFGLGSREIVGTLLYTFYARKNYAIGDKIKTKNIEGTIEGIDSIFVNIKTKEGRLVVPIKEIVKNRVKVEA